MRAHQCQLNLFASQLRTALKTKGVLTAQRRLGVIRPTMLHSKLLMAAHDKPTWNDFGEVTASVATAMELPLVVPSCFSSQSGPLMRFALVLAD